MNSRPAPSFRLGLGRDLGLAANHSRTSLPADRSPRRAPRVRTTCGGILAILALGLTLAASQSHAASVAETRWSAAALYNLGNSYARAGQPGLAVLNYERARLLAPNDPDIEANLRQVRDAAHLPSDTRSGFARSVTAVSPAVASWLGVVGVLVLGASVLAGRTRARPRWLYRSTAVAGVALMGFTVCQAVVLWPALHAAVVLTAGAPVRVSPVPMGDPLFTLAEAETVRILSQHEDFVLVRTLAGKTGWIARANIEPVIPEQRPRTVGPRQPSSAYFRPIRPWAAFRLSPWCCCRICPASTSVPGRVEIAARRSTVSENMVSRRSRNVVGRLT
jgi:hypothetical protein